MLNIEGLSVRTRTDDDVELRGLFTYLINYNLDQVIDIPLTYQKDMIVYNTSKIQDFTFEGTPCFFDVTNLKPVE